MVELFDAAAESKGGRVEALVNTPVLVIADRDLLFDAVANLVDNAIKHGRVGGLVTVSVDRKDGEAVILVSDDGPGIPATAFDFVVCQQGLQFFPDRLAALSEMRRALKPDGGQLAIAAWSHIEDNAFYAALHAALRECVPGDLAARLLAPFSWPDAQVLKNTVEAAGFHEIRVRCATLPLIFEGGIAQAARALAASPLAPSLATLPAGAHLRLNAAIGAHLAPLLRDGKVSANMTSNIAIARP